MAEVLAIGNDTSSLVTALKSLPFGQPCTIELNFDRSLSAAEVTGIQNKLSGYNVSRSFTGKTLKIRYAPSSNDGIGLLPLILLIPLIIGGGLLSWKILGQVTAVMTAIQSIPTIAWIAGSVVVLGLGGYILFGRKQQVVTRVIGKLKG